MTEEAENRRYCPACGFRTLPKCPRRNRFEVCPICHWEDDPVQSDRPDSAIGANRVSLLEARRNFRNYGAIHPESVEYTREPTEDDERDPEWPYEEDADDEI